MISQCAGIVRLILKMLVNSNLFSTIDPAFFHLNYDKDRATNYFEHVLARIQVDPVECSDAVMPIVKSVLKRDEIRTGSHHAHLLRLEKHIN